jgi:23S rRNA (cytidine1920-2'-O)/16S rRNA (cytidine1409-2'-O)-methyltransferase
MTYVSRAALKLEHALKTFKIDVCGLTCADFGSNVGGFVQILLENDAKKVFSVDTSYGTLDWNLRNNPKVTVLERTNAMHVKLPEKCNFISLDTGWTTQTKVLPNVLLNLAPKGQVVTLVKPHYEAKKYGFNLKKGQIQVPDLENLLIEVKKGITDLGFKVIGEVESPIKGKHGGNTEYLLYLMTSKTLQ